MTVLWLTLVGGIGFPRYAHKDVVVGDGDTGHARHRPGRARSRVVMMSSRSQVARASTPCGEDLADAVQTLARAPQGWERVLPRAPDFLDDLAFLVDSSESPVLLVGGAPQGWERV